MQCGEAGARAAQREVVVASQSCAVVAVCSSHAIFTVSCPPRPCADGNGSHELFPTAARKRAVEVMRLGYLIAWDEERFDSREGAAPGLVDLWRSFVLPRVVVR